VAELKASKQGQKIEEELGLTGSPEEQASIAKMQAMQRGKIARQELADQQSAASKIAAVQRGKQDRARVAGMKVEKELGLTGSEEEGQAIAKIQVC
jgi:fructose/tagatose bisphosphate aldolase